MSECCMPACLAPTTRRDDGTWACELHAKVRVSAYGTWVADRHGEAS